MKKHLLILACSLFSFFSMMAQSGSCVVKLEAINGTYTGDCKDGKANGNGKSVGTDQYEGHFKNGLPDGEGKYTWKNGDVYTGNFKKGLKEGKGTLLKSADSATGKTLTGYWKKDEYFGEYEVAYKVLSSTPEVSRVEVENISGGKIMKTIKVVIENTTGNMPTFGSITPQMKLTDVRVAHGTYIQRTDNTKYKNVETTFSDVEFPFRAVFYIGGNSVEAEFYIPGNYILNIFINK